MARPTTLALAVLPFASTPAIPAHATTEFGVKGGPTFSDVNVDDLGSSNQIGWGAGSYLDLATPLLHLQPEAIFTRVGFRDATFTDDTSNAPLDYRL